MILSMSKHRGKSRREKKRKSVSVSKKGQCNVDRGKTALNASKDNPKMPEIMMEFMKPYLKFVHDEDLFKALIALACMV